MKANGAIKIESGIPLPHNAGSRGRGSAIADAMRAMKVGDSILVSGKTKSAISTAAAHYIGKGKYAIRPEGNGSRVWKVG